MHCVSNDNGKYDELPFLAAGWAIEALEGKYLLMDVFTCRMLELFRVRSKRLTARTRKAPRWESEVLAGRGRARKHWVKVRGVCCDVGEFEMN